MEFTRDRSIYIYLGFNSYIQVSKKLLWESNFEFPKYVSLFYNPFGTHFLVNEIQISSREANKHNLTSSPQRFRLTLQAKAREVKVFLILAMYIFLACDIFSGHYPWCSLNSQLIHPNWLIPWDTIGKFGPTYDCRKCYSVYFKGAGK